MPGYHWGGGGLIDASLAYECPTCKAGVREKCVYVTANSYYSDQRPGMHTQVPHRARFTAMHAYQGTQSQVTRAKAHAIRAAERKTAWVRSEVRTRSIRAALREFDMREYRDMHSWLAEYGPVLWK